MHGRVTRTSKFLAVGMISKRVLAQLEDRPEQSVRHLYRVPKAKRAEVDLNRPIQEFLEGKRCQKKRRRVEDNHHTHAPQVPLPTILAPSTPSVDHNSKARNQSRRKSASRPLTNARHLTYHSELGHAQLGLGLDMRLTRVNSFPQLVAAAQTLKA